MLISVKIDSEDLKELLVERLKYWIDNESSTEYLLYERALEKLVDNNYFDDCLLDIKGIVDNFYVNDTIIYYSKENLEEDGDTDEKIITNIGDRYLCFSY